MSVFRRFQLAIAMAMAMAMTCVSTAGTASASGIPGASFGYEQGSVVAANPTAIAYNPGALGFSGTQLFLDVSLAIREFSWTHARGRGDAPEPTGFEGANYGTAHATTIGAGPQFAASVQVDRFALGGGWYVPYGGGTLEFDRNEAFAQTIYPGAVDGVARWHGYDASTSVFFGVLGAAYRLGPLSLGAVANLVVNTIEVSRAQNSPIAGNDIRQEQRVYLEADTVTGGFALGAMLEAVPRALWLGASYQAQPGLGEMSLDGTYTLDPTIGVDGPTRKQKVTLYQALPDIIRAGARWRPSPAFELRLTGTYTRWSLNQTQCLAVRDKPCTVYPDGGAAMRSGVIRAVRRHWSDTVAVRLGISYLFSERVELFTGLGFENAAIPASTLDPLAADADNIAAALGVRLKVGDTWFVAASYNHLQFFERDTTGKSDLAAPNIETTSRSVDGGGIYKQWWALVNVNIAKTF